MNNKHLKYYPKVSIITCVYNGEKYISKLLDSVLNMGYPNIEHIIVNDGSTDSTEGIVMKYAELYKNKENSNLYIKYIKQDNMGLGGATNTGLKQITSEYWTWINCDDWYMKHAFFEPIEYLQRNPIKDYIQLNGYDVFPDKKIINLIIENDNKMSFYKKERLIKQYFFGDNDFRWLLYICRTSSYKKICSSMQIYPSRYTQDDQLIAQLFGTLNGAFCKAPKWFFLHREDSFFFKCRLEHINEQSTLIKESIELLSVEEKLKRTLIALFQEPKYINNIRKLAIMHKPKEVVRYHHQNRIRKHVKRNFNKYFDHNYLLYLLYSFVIFLK